MDQSMAVSSRAPIPPPRLKKRLKALSIDQVKSHSEPSSPILVLSKKKPAPPRPPPRPNILLARGSSTEQDKSNGPLQANHPRVKKRASAPPLRPPPPPPTLVKNSQEGRKIPPVMHPPPKGIPPRLQSSLANPVNDQSNARSTPPPRPQSSLANPVNDQSNARSTPPPRPRSSLANLVNDQSNARSTPPRPQSSLAMATRDKSKVTDQSNARAASANPFHTGPRVHKNKKGMERTKSNPDSKSVKDNESKREPSLYLNVAPRLPDKLRKKCVELAYNQKPRCIRTHKSTENLKLQNHKRMQQTSSPSSPRIKSPVKNDMLHQTKLGPLPPLPPLPPEKVVPYAVYAEIHKEPDGVDYSYVDMTPRFDVKGTSRHLESLDLELSRRNSADAYVNNDYNGQSPRLPTSQSAEYMPLLTKNRIDDDIYADPQHDEQHDDSEEEDSPEREYAVVNAHTINQERKSRESEITCYMSLSNQTLEENSDYQPLSLIPQT